MRLEKLHLKLSTAWWFPGSAGGCHSAKLPAGRIKAPVALMSTRPAGWRNRGVDQLRGEC